MSLLPRTLKLHPIKGTIQCITRLLSTTTITNQPPKPLALLHMKINENPWIYRQPDIIKIPTITKITPITLPNGKLWIPLIEKENTAIEAPPLEKTEIQAARLIVIRRKKMKKHKLRKLRKRMKFEWAKIRQRRELKKEKEFQAGLIAQYKKAEEFSAEKYVEERLEKLHELIIPKMYKGRRMPEFLIRQKLGLPPKQ